ncbi:MAG: hypothetical protein IPM54_41270 [Polyangiaceae bacterium]|nr:hypothetical protein [Polyangiaceae bacterium]
MLARARYLLPDAHEALDHRAFLDPDRMAEAIRMCGTTPEWARFDAEDVSQIKRMVDAIRGDVYVIGESAHGGGLQAILAAREEFENIQHVVDFGSDVTLIGVTAPIIGLVHHEAQCTVVRCIAAPGSPEDPRDLERRLRRQIERRRNEVLKLLALPVQQVVLAILKDKRRIDAIKYLRTELVCTLSDAKDIIYTIDPWWPSGLSTVTGNCPITGSGDEES